MRMETIQIRIDLFYEGNVDLQALQDRLAEFLEYNTELLQDENAELTDYATEVERIDG